MLSLWQRLPIVVRAVIAGLAVLTIGALPWTGIAPVHPPGAPVQGPMDEPIVHGWMPAAAVFFKDPDGHLLELIADLTEAPRPDFIYRPLSEWRTLAEKGHGEKDGNAHDA